MTFYRTEIYECMMSDTIAVSIQLNGNMLLMQ